MNTTAKLGTFALALSALATPALSQKYKTDIPPAITIPDKVETRLGTLTFKDGFPDDATVQKGYDNLDFQRGVQAFLTCMPAASLSAMREGYKSIGVNNSTVAVWEDLMDAAHSSSPRRPRACPSWAGSI